ncbi:hypothetical protein EI42_00671 [Thermosporothrix hazakensis]|jgi:cytochrome c-type biogenesis protein CcmH/NrfF|uniref:Uncharacterized protein n=2 Tax=Thermosporothrix TaxID=768650 RepID=A0A326UEZ3_THEHA|nr:hypothetical protein [Thermosporothrix hazakensis]PZW36495.1 hypothetical protein EI42_00671 [Thermosporothrix hazakensis]BBH88963.1 hypothetical protein KTC_37140 [Thermosporothrix sp. COM3]GCE47149.1 hypothetical protein KTH_20180 [Thermosporothrix hazakensis]
MNKKKLMLWIIPALVLLLALTLVAIQVTTGVHAAGAGTPSDPGVIHPFAFFPE